MNFELTEFGFVVETETGVRCGNKATHGEKRVYHRTAEGVRYCFDQERYMREQVEEDHKAEVRYLNHLENRGFEEAREEEKRSSGWWNLPIAASMWAADGRDLYA